LFACYKLNGLQKGEYRNLQMQETGMGDESTQLLGEDGLRAGGQTPMKLG
jgi:hypothetical protein